MRERAVYVATWVLSRIVSRGEREPLLGDLAEEYALRANAGRASAALQWYLQQACASAVLLMWARLRRATWIRTGGVALFAYIAVGLVEFIVNLAIRGPSTSRYNALGLVITFPMVVLIGYFAERFRRRAAMVLGAMMLLAVIAMTVWATERVPTWYRIAYFFVGPTAACIGSLLGSVLRSRQQPDS